MNDQKLTFAGAGRGKSAFTGEFAEADHFFVVSNRAIEVADPQVYRPETGQRRQFLRPKTVSL